MSRSAFKNALCLAGLPEGAPWLGPRFRSCQRKADHKGPHRSWSREWGEGDKESRLTVYARGRG